MVSLRENLAVGAFWTVSFRMLTRVIGLLSTAILARILSPDDFGLVTLAVTSVAIVFAFTEFGPEQYLISHQNCEREEYDTAWTLQVVRGLGIALLMFAFSDDVARFYNDDRLDDLLIVLGAGIFLRSVGNIGVVDFRKHLNFKRDFQLLLVSRLISFSTTIILAFLLRNYWALIWGLMSGHAAHVIASYLMHDFRPRISLSYFGKVFGYSKWLFASSILHFLIHKFDSFLVGKMLGIRTLGIYSLGNEISSLATTELAAPIRRAILPGYSKVSDNIKVLRELYLDVFAVTLAISLPAAVGIMATSDLIVLVFLGDQWVDLIPIIEIVAFAGVLQTLGNGAAPLFLVIKKPQLTTYSMLATLAFQIPLMVWGIQEFGIQGAAWALVGTWVFRQLIMFYLVVKTIDTKVIEYVSRCWRTVVSAVVLYYSLYLLRGLLTEPIGFWEQLTAFVLCSALGAIAYSGSHLGLWKFVGSPAGPERRLLQAVTLFFRKIFEEN